MISLFVLAGGLISPIFAQEDFVQDVSFQEETLEVRVIEILKEEEIWFEGEGQLYQNLECLVTKGSLKDERIFIESGHISMVNLQKYKEGDQLVIYRTQDLEGNDLFYISDYIRRKPLLLLFFIFIVLAIAVAKWRGLGSLLGMGLSFLIIFKFILPKISSGASPILIAIIGSLFIIPVTFYFSHGLNKKTTAAVIGTLVSLVITGILAGIFVKATRLTGFASEEAAFLQVAKGETVNIRGILLAGIIIGVLGILDDVAVSQSAIVFKLKQANPKINPKELYKKAMDVGRDHIASMVNTLVLVYAGAALPLLLLFIDSPHPFSEVINYEIIADEVVRVLVGSIGLILAVPITTLIASLTAKRVR